MEDGAKRRFWHDPLVIAREIANLFPDVLLILGVAVILGSVHFDVIGGIIFDKKFCLVCSSNYLFCAFC